MSESRLLSFASRESFPTIVPPNKRPEQPYPEEEENKLHERPRYEDSLRSRLESLDINPGLMSDGMTPSISSEVHSIDKLDTPIDPQGLRKQELQTELDHILTMARGETFAKPAFGNSMPELNFLDQSYMNESTLDFSKRKMSDSVLDLNSGGLEESPKDELDDELQLIQDHIYSSSKKVLLQAIILNWREATRRINVLNTSADDYRKHKILTLWYLKSHNMHRLSMITSQVAQKIELDQTTKLLESWRENILSNRRSIEQSHKYSQNATKATLLKQWRNNNSQLIEKRELSEIIWQKHLKHEYFERIAKKYRRNIEQVTLHRLKADRAQRADILKAMILDYKSRKTQKSIEMKILANYFRSWKVESSVARLRRINNSRIAFDIWSSWRQKLQDLSPLYAELHSLEFGLKKAKFAALLITARKQLKRIEDVKALDPDLIAAKHRITVPLMNWRGKLRERCLERLGEETEIMIKKKRAMELFKSWRNSADLIAHMRAEAAEQGHSSTRKRTMLLWRERLTQVERLNSLADPTDRLKFIGMETLKESFNALADMQDKATDYQLQIEAAIGSDVLRDWQQRASATRRLTYLATSRLNAAMKRERNSIFLYWRLNTRPRSRAPPSSSQSRSPLSVELSPRLRQRIVSQSPRLALYKTPRKLGPTGETNPVNMPGSAPARFVDNFEGADTNNDDDNEEVYTPTRPRRRDEHMLRLPHA